MLKLIGLELKKASRNKRFVIFTILLPLLFFVILRTAAGDVNRLSISYLYYVCIMYGMIGNNIVTLGTKIAKEKNFYLSIFKRTKFNIVANTVIQFVTQAVLNLLIVGVLSLAGVLFLGLQVNVNLVWNLLLVFLFCNSFSFIGTLLGYVFDPVSLQVISNPIYMSLMLLSLPNELVRMFPKLFRQVYQVFPGHLVWNLIDQINDNQLSQQNLILFFTYLGVIILISLVLLVFKQTREVERS